MTADVPRIRLRIIGVVAVSLLVALVARLWFLQVMHSEGYEQRAIANIERTVKVSAPRGRVLDAHGRVLVDNRLVTTLSIDKAALAAAYPGTAKAEERTAMLTRLAVEISKSGDLIKVEEIERKLRNSQYSKIGLVPISNDITDELMVLVGENRDLFPGVEVSQTTVRDYPYGSLASHVHGYVGPINDTEHAAKKGSSKGYDLTDSIGKTGIESLFEEHLRGTPGTRVFEVDRRERVIRELVEKNTQPIPGNDVYLTIDIGLQAQVENDLRVALEEARQQPKRNTNDPDITAPAGAAVVLDPRDGSVLAMASHPTYDPSEFVAGIEQERFAQLRDPANFTPLLNRAIQGEYAPGSTFKPFTAYAAITNGFMGNGALPAIYQRVDDPGTYRLVPCDGDKCSWTNARNAAGQPLTFDNIDMLDALTFSSDVYFYAIAAEVARSGRGTDHAIQDAAAAFGLGSQTAVQLPSERSGRVGDRELRQRLHEQSPEAFPNSGWFVGDTINVSVGQGETVVTPLQLANAYATLGNGGTVFAPNVVREVRHQDTNELVLEFSERATGTVPLPPEVRDPIVRGLYGVTAREGGTGYRAFHDPATADFDLNAWPVAGKTGTAEVYKKADSALFAAYMGPAGQAPQYAMAVVLEESGFGGANAAPVVAKVFDAIVEQRIKDPLTVDDYASCVSLAKMEPEDRSAGSSTDESGTIVLPNGKACS